MFKNLQKEVKDITKGVVELTYFMRGAVSYNEMMEMTPGERDIIKEFIDERLESEAQKPFPVY